MSEQTPNNQSLNDQSNNQPNVESESNNSPHDNVSRDSADTKVSSHLPMVTKEGDYVARARQEIERWKHPKQNMLGKALGKINAPIDKAGDALMNSEQFGETIKTATEKMLTTLSETANWSINIQNVLKNVAETSSKSEPSEQSAEPSNTATSDDNAATNADIKTLADIHKLPLQTIDESVKLLKSRYVALTSAQGVATGVVGWAGIPADIVGLITANLRAIAEYATHYGFDMSQKSEQLYAISLLSIATSQSADERRAALDQTLDLVKSPEALAFNKINEELMSRVIRQTATKVATTLVKSKAAQVIPAAGAVVAGGVNASYTASVCEAAYQCYRERFLNRQQATV